MNNTDLLQIGEKLNGGRYEIVRHIASGGFGNTYEAEDTKLGIRCAIKEFFLQNVTQRDSDTNHISVSNPGNSDMFANSKSKFKKEAKRLARLKHPHIVRVNDLFEENNTVYYVMDYIDGCSLSQKMKAQGCPYTEQESIGILTQMLDALQTVHSQGLLHMDIKPGNIMTDTSGHCLLIDFGASKQLDDNSGQTTSSTLAYTKGYAPPEQLDGKKERWGPWTDIYALGATMYNLVTGHVPPRTVDILSEGENAFVYPVGVSAQFKQFICQMMQPSFANRPQTADATRELLNSLVNAEHSNPAEVTIILAPSSANNSSIPVSVASVENKSTTMEQEQQVASAANGKKGSRKWTVICLSSFIAILVVVLLFLFLGRGKKHVTSRKNAEEIGIEEILEKAEKGDAVAQYNLARCYAKGWLIETNRKEAVAWYKKAAKQGDEKAKGRLGQCYYKGWDVEKDYDRAIQYFREGSVKGDAYSMYMLGECYEKGNGVASDSIKADEWYKKAVAEYRKDADDGDVCAMVELGGCYENGQGVPKSYEEARYWYWKAAEQEDAHGQYNLGVCYLVGNGEPQDYEEALRLFRMAAEQGDGRGQASMGVIYEYGYGVSKDINEAVKLYRKAAEQGNAGGQCNLGRCYENGNGVTKDINEALNWYRKAAEQEFARGQFYLGRCYEDGNGVPKDIKEAVKWYRKAAEQGDELAVEALKRLGKQ